MPPTVGVLLFGSALYTSLAQHHQVVHLTRWDQPDGRTTNQVRVPKTTCLGLASYEPDVWRTICFWLQLVVLLGNVPTRKTQGRVVQSTKTSFQEVGEWKIHSEAMTCDPKPTPCRNPPSPNPTPLLCHSPFHCPMSLAQLGFIVWPSPSPGVRGNVRAEGSADAQLDQDVSPL